MSTETANPFLTWAPPESPVVIRISHGVMARLNIEVMRGFGVTRRRGTETGGLLLGKIDRKPQKPVIYIEDFDVVPCEYALGPSYILSAGDQQRFKEAVTKWQPSLNREAYAVGYFRSHTREGFVLDEKDAAVFREFFPDSLDIALLVKPFATRPAIAGFFLKENGVLVTTSTPEEFKFEAPIGSGGQHIAEAPNQEPEVISRTAPPPPAEPTEPRLRPVGSRRARIDPPPVEADLFTSHIQPPSRGWRWIGWTAFLVALFCFGAACGFEYAGRKLQKGATGLEQRGITGLPNADLYGVQLQAIKVGNGVMVKWNRDAAPIQAALTGTLTVTEGPHSKDVKLSFAELRNGTALYPSVGPDIGFRLEIYFKDNRSFIERTTFKDASK